MANVSDTCTTQSIGINDELARMGSDPERILRSANSSSRKAFAKLNTSSNADDQVVTLEQALDSDDEGPPSPMAREQAQPTA